MSAHTGHPIRGRLNAWFLAYAETAMHEEYGDRKVSMLGPIPETVVELGPGSGANFRYYPRGTRVIAFEPNPMMHRRMNAQALRHGIRIDLRHAGAEGMDVETSSVELVVSTLVLCSVREPERVVAEVRRVLKPGGRLVFLEHVAAPSGTRLRRVQDIIHRPWHWLGEGCNLTRDTASTLQNAGFSSLELERFDSGMTWAPYSPHIAGVAIR
jgi:ubiquinone/menaquinone biosynthesis C-methylase UbiE